MSTSTIGYLEHVALSRMHIVYLAIVSSASYEHWSKIPRLYNRSSSRVYTFTTWWGCVIQPSRMLQWIRKMTNTDFPEPCPLPRDTEVVPYFIIADDVFAIRTWLMKPFSKRHLSKSERIFNYRLSRALRIVENAFSILSNWFQCLVGTLEQDPKTVQSIVLSCVYACTTWWWCVIQPSRMLHWTKKMTNTKLSRVPGEQMWILQTSMSSEATEWQRWQNDRKSYSSSTTTIQWELSHGKIWWFDWM